jgi:hypothetical protein
MNTSRAFVPSDTTLGPVMICATARASASDGTPATNSSPPANNTRLPPKSVMELGSRHVLTEARPQGEFCSQWPKPADCHNRARQKGAA